MASCIVPLRIKALRNGLALNTVYMDWLNNHGFNFASEEEMNAWTTRNWTNALLIECLIECQETISQKQKEYNDMWAKAHQSKTVPLSIKKLKKYFKHLYMWTKKVTDADVIAYLREHQDYESFIAACKVEYPVVVEITAREFELAIQGLQKYDNILEEIAEYTERIKAWLAKGNGKYVHYTEHYSLQEYDPKQGYLWPYLAFDENDVACVKVIQRPNETNEISAKVIEGYFIVGDTQGLIEYLARRGQNCKVAEDVLNEEIAFMPSFSVIPKFTSDLNRGLMLREPHMQWMNTHGFKFNNLEELRKWTKSNWGNPILVQCLIECKAQFEKEKADYEAACKMMQVDCKCPSLVPVRKNLEWGGHENLDDDEIAEMILRYPNRNDFILHYKKDFPHACFISQQVFNQIREALQNWQENKRQFDIGHAIQRRMREKGKIASWTAPLHYELVEYNPADGILWPYHALHEDGWHGCVATYMRPAVCGELTYEALKAFIITQDFANMMNYLKESGVPIVND